MSTQCVTIPKDLTSAPAKRDFTKMEKTALVTIKYNCLLLSFQGNHFHASDATSTSFPASKDPTVKPLDILLHCPRLAFIFLAGPRTNSAAAGPLTCTDLPSLRHMMCLLLWIPTESMVGNVVWFSVSIIDPSSSLCVSWFVSWCHRSCSLVMW